MDTAKPGWLQQMHTNATNWIPLKCVQSFSSSFRRPIGSIWFYHILWVAKAFLLYSNAQPKSFDRLPWWNCIRWGPSASSCEPLQLTKNRTIGAMVNPPPSFEEALAEILFHSWDERERMTSEWYHVVLNRFSSMFPFFCNMIQPITWIRKGKKLIQLQEIHILNPFWTSIFAKNFGKEALRTKQIQQRWITQANLLRPCRI